MSLTGVLLATHKMQEIMTMSRRIQITDESFGLLEEMGLDIDHVIRSTYALISAIKTVEVCADDDVYRRVQHLSLTVDENTKLLSDYTQEEIDDVLDQMENWAKLKNKRSAYLTAKNWLSRRAKEKPKQEVLEYGSEEWLRRNS